MGKKKKKKVEETETEGFSLDSASLSTKKTKTALQGLLSGVKEDDGLLRHQRVEAKIEPKLTYEKKPNELDNPNEIQIDPSKYMSPGIPSDPLPDPLPGPPPGPPPEEEVEEDIYEKLSLFFEGFIDGYSETYKRWENSISNLLSILRKMRKITKKNTENLVSSITNLFDKTEEGLSQFETKRNEIEKVSQVNIEGMSHEFKKVLGLLELQIKEYQLKRISDEYIHARKLLT